ncbi:MAG: filamentous hemagglutinin N-terminal domain-containing protein [Phycisphaerales bacterium]|nr:filamentous hemagglutinin N-terminal domain-containing protein [Phycisphaerales bacterium]
MRPRNASWLEHSNGRLAACLTAIWCAAATASPEGGTFIHGDGTITSYGGGVATVVELIGPDRFIIGWDDFDVAAGESVVFNGVNFTALNTINTGAPSSTWLIDGTINAPGGEVWFVNPAGVMFSETAVLDVGGLIAAAGSIDHGDFIAGNDVFNLTGHVSFAGTMQADNVLARRAVLMGHSVENSGLLKGEMIALASGDTIKLVDLGTRITLEIDGSALDAATPSVGTAASMSGQAAVANHGRIETAAGGQVLLASGDALGAALTPLAIEHDGEIASAGGQVEFIALDGAIRTDQVTGVPNAHVTNAGLIDTSSAQGAGTIALTGPAVVVGSSLRAQGGIDGSGGAVSIRGSGSVVLAGSEVAGWSDAGAGHAGTGSISTTGGGGGHSAGSILIDAGSGRAVGSTGAALTATGGVSGGDGGVIEIRGGELQWNARSRASAVNGEGGFVSWSATDALRITADGSTASADFADLLAGASGDSFIGSTLAQSLGYADTDMSVATNSLLTIESSIAGLPNGGPTRLTGDATFIGDRILLADATGATQLQAGGSLSLLGDVVMSNCDAVLSSGQRDGVSGTTFGGFIRAEGDYRGDLDLSSPGAVQIGGDVGFEGTEIGSLVLRSVGDMQFIDGNRAIRAIGDVTLASMDGGALAVSLNGDLQVRAEGDITFGDGLTITGNASLDARAGGHLENWAIEHIAEDLTFIGNTLENHSALTVGDALHLRATGGTLMTNSALDVGSDAQLAGMTGVDCLAPVTTGGDLSIDTSAGSVQIDGPLSAGGRLELTAGQDITSSADISTGASLDRGEVNIDAGGDIMLDGVLLAVGDDVHMQAGGSVDASQVEARSLDIEAGATTRLGDVTLSQTLQAQTGTAFELDGGLSATDVSVTAGSVNLAGGSSVTQTGEGDVQLTSGGDASLGGSINAEGHLTAQAGAIMTVSADVAANTAQLRADQQMHLDGATIASNASDVLGGTSLLIEAPVIEVSGSTTATSQSGIMQVSGAAGIAEVNVDAASLQMESMGGPLLFLASADGSGDLSLTSTNDVLYMGGDLGGTSPLASIDLEGAAGLQLGGVVPLNAEGTAYDVQVIRATGHVGLQTADVDAITDGVASIQGFSEHLDVISLEGDIELGRNQGMVQLGGLQLQAAGTIDVTDVTALGDLTLSANEVLIQRRDAMEIQDDDGSFVTSPQTAIVAGGVLTLDAQTLRFNGTGDDPLLGGLGGSIGVPEENLAEPDPFTRNDLVLEAANGPDELLLERLAQELDNIESAGDTIAAESQSTQSMPDFLLLEGNEAPLTEDALAQMGIMLRPLAQARGHASRLARPGEVTVDLVTGPGPAAVGRVVVTRTRLLRRQVDLAIEQWRGAWGGQEALPSQVVGEDDQKRVRRGLAAAWAHLRLAGLTSSEIDASKQFVLDRLVARGTSPELAVSLIN